MYLERGAGHRKLGRVRGGIFFRKGAVEFFEVAFVREGSRTALQRFAPLFVF